MFRRSASFVLDSLKSESIKTGVRYSAQSKKKRISVQLLKDFPGVGVKGQIVQVRASAMINRLHPNNGAVYLNIPDAKPLIPVVKPEELKKQQPVKEKVEERPQELEKKAQESELLSLEDLVSFGEAELVATDRPDIIRNIPKKLIFVNESKDKVLKNPIELATIKNNLTKFTSRDISDSKIKTSVTNFFESEDITIVIKNEAGNLDKIVQVGGYNVLIKEGDKILHSVRLYVNSKNEK